MFSSKLMMSPWPALWWDEIDSTSLEASRRAANGDLGPVWLAARSQNGGRGRLGRKWVSEPGNLYTTAIFPLDKLSPDVASLSLSCGLAVRDCVIELTQGQVIPGLKWPNDVRVDGRKLCGILLESGQSAHTGIWLSIGIGLNIAHAPDLGTYETCCLLDFSPAFRFSPEDVLTVLDNQLRHRLDNHLKNGLSSVIDDWTAATDQFGLRYKVVINGKDVVGEFAGLDASGQMCLKTETGDTFSVAAGEVVQVKESDANASGY